MSGDDTYPPSSYAFSVVMLHPYADPSKARPVRKPWADRFSPDPAFRYTNAGAHSNAQQIKRDGVRKVMCIVNVYPKPVVPR